ncbi:hypothetical protein GCK32_021550 [Trichostrongylus colubriformis]|uniref:Uncharacterized protein n=1 Tax=Trichostrongylus colubriformis TaxID=6319 RepID=A0AAN8EMN1_TRICO
MVAFMRLLICPRSRCPIEFNEPFSLQNVLIVTHCPSSTPCSVLTVELSGIKRVFPRQRKFVDNRHDQLIGA